MKKNFIKIAAFASLLVLTACGGDKKKSNGTVETPKDTTTQVTKPDVQAPDFNAEQAFEFVKEQVAFGPRVPNTTAHKACGDYLEKQLKSFSDTVIVQTGKVTAYTGDELKIKNMMGRFQVENPKRILLIAHWDTRPTADMDPNPANRNKAVLGADDGGSGVAVLLEIARILQQTKPSVGVDILLVDAEDYGNPGGASETYCLGTQYWANNNPITGYTATFGILLDMVGAKNASFAKEGYSLQFAAGIVNKVWNAAAKLGHQQYFNTAQIEPITDDHYFVNTMMHIPTIDILNFNPMVNRRGFGDHWHTVNDNIDIIDKNTLKAVGETVLFIIFNE